MNINYYRYFNIDLFNFPDNILIDHFNNYSKIENRIYNEETFYKFYPDFDYILYGAINKDLIYFSKFELQTHFHLYGNKENRIYCLDIFYNKFPNFDFNFYKNYYEDLINKNDYYIYIHYYEIGHIENRIFCFNNFNGNYNKFIEVFNIENPNFDYNFYNNYYYDLSIYKNKLKLMQNYYFIGKKEHRYISENDFNDKNPDFINNFKINNPDFDIDYFKKIYKLYGYSDILLMIYYEKHKNTKYKNTKYKIYNNNSYLRLLNEFDYIFYKNFYDDLENYNTNEELLEHYNKYGILENRIINIYYFNIAYPDFDIEYYKNFNNLEINNISSFYKHFINIGLETNKKYFEYDFEINNYYENIYPSNYVNETDSIYKKIHNINQLLNYKKNYIKKYFIYNKESFFKYYYDFDLEYYKDKYFKNTNKTDYEILLYYHIEGKNLKHTTNNKLKIVIYTPVFDIKCGGIVVLHNLARLINELHNPNIYAKLFIINNFKYKNIFCNDFATIDDIDDNTFVIYPEIVSGNPLNAKKFMRWILLDSTGNMPLNNYENWDKKDLIYFWETKEKNNIYFKQLSCPWLNNIFYNKGLKFEERTKTCYLVKKGSLIHKNINYYHNSDSIYLDHISSLKEKCDIFNLCKYFYCYDPNSMYVIYALLCGCIPIIYPLDGVPKIEYMKNRIYNCNNELIDIGFAYDNSESEINNAIEKIKDSVLLINKIFDFYKNNVNTFCNEIYNNIFNNIELDNTIENYYK
jgi:hypothetical protein